MWIFLLSEIFRISPVILRMVWLRYLWSFGNIGPSIWWTYLAGHERVAADSRSFWSDEWRPATPAAPTSEALTPSTRVWAIKGTPLWDLHFLESYYLQAGCWGSYTLHSVPESHNPLESMTFMAIYKPFGWWIKMIPESALRLRKLLQPLEIPEPSTIREAIADSSSSEINVMHKIINQVVLQLNCGSVNFVSWAEILRML